MTDPYRCPACERPVTAEKQWTTFPYGAGTRLVELPVELNVFSCVCGEQFLDHTAEDAKEDAIRRWLEGRSESPR